MFTELAATHFTTVRPTAREFGSRFFPTFLVETLHFQHSPTLNFPYGPPSLVKLSPKKALDRPPCWS